VVDNDGLTFAYVLFTASGASQTAQITAFNSLDPYEATATPYWTIYAAKQSGTATLNLYTRIRIDTYTGPWKSVLVTSASMTSFHFWDQERTSNDWRQAKIDFYAQAGGGMVQINVADLVITLLVSNVLRRSTDLITRRIIFAPLAFVPTAKSVPVPLLGQVVPPMPIPSRAVLFREEPPEEITW
jgi:hypothetical protein